MANGLFDSFLFDSDMRRTYIIIVSELLVENESVFQGSKSSYFVRLKKLKIKKPKKALSVPQLLTPQNYNPQPQEIVINVND